MTPARDRSGVRAGSLRVALLHREGPLDAGEVLAHEAAKRRGGVGVLGEPGPHRVGEDRAACDAKNCGGLRTH